MKPFPRPVSPLEASELGGLIGLIQNWGQARKIIGPDQQADLGGQTSKLIEEACECREAYFETQGLQIMAEILPNLSFLDEERDKAFSDAHAKLVDGIGDTMVVCIMLCAMANVTVLEALQKAWIDIKDRKGEMRNGKFVKEADL